MKLLFDQNLSHRLVKRLGDLFPGSTQTRLAGLNAATDSKIWDHALAHDLTVVTLDKDFADLSFLKGFPPKVIWLRCGNSSVPEIEQLIRANFDSITRFAESEFSGVLEIWP